MTRGRSYVLRGLGIGALVGATRLAIAAFSGSLGTHPATAAGTVAGWIAYVIPFALAGALIGLAMAAVYGRKPNTPSS